MSGFEGRVMEVFWDGFDKSIRAELDWFWRDQRTLTDVTVCCENGSVRAHKLVLALSSSYFHNMCVQSQSACSNSVISLPDVKVEDFKLILEYMYRGKVFIDEMAAERLIKLARVLHIKGFGSQNRPPKERQRSGSESSQYVDSDDNEGQRTKRPKVHIRPEEIALDNVPHNRVTRATASNRALTSANDTRNARSQTPTSRRVPGSQTSRVRKLSEPQECNSSKSSHEKLLSGSMIGDAFEGAAAVAEEPGPSGTRISSSSLEAAEKARVRNAKMIDKQGHNTSALVEKAGPSGSKISKLLETNESPENQDPSGGREKRPLLKRRSSTSPAKQLTKNVTLLASQSAESKSTPNISAALSNLVTNDNDTLRDGALPGSRFSLSEKCNECDFTAGSAVELATHKIQEHTKPRPVPKPPTRKRQMNSPLSDETKEAAKDDQLYVCDLCGFSSKNRGALGSHRNRHKFEQETTSPKNLPLNLRANSVHFKPIYDCPKCINISFKTLNVMSRHFARRHFDENLQYITRVACSHCVHSYSQSDGFNEYKKHLKEIHGIEAEFEISEKLSLNLSRETNPGRRTSLFENGDTNEPSPILTNGNGEASRPEPGPSGVNHPEVPAGNDHLVETASNADTERASSRGSFVVSLNEQSAKAPTPGLDLKRCRLSNDDETTIEADLSKVKTECSRNSSPVSVFHKCTDCNYQTSQLHFLRRHAIACHSNGTNEDPFLCRFCNFATAHRSTIKSHLVSVHRDSNTKISECYRNSERIREFFQANGTGSAKEPQRLQQKQQTKTGRVRLTKSAPPAAVSSEADESEGSPSPDNNNKEKSVIKKSAKKHGRQSQQFDAALKLKKAALAKQRNLSPQNCAVSETKAAHLSRTRASPRRSSSRQSAAGNSPSKRRSSSKFPTSLKCPDCTYEAKSYQMFTKHSILHQDVDETKLALCEVCGVVKLKSSMFYHLKKHQVDPPKTPARLSQ